MNFKDVTKLFNLLREKISLVRNFSHKDVLPLINELKRTIKGKIYLLSGALIVTLVAVSFICILTTIGSHEGMEAFYKDYSAIELKINDARCIEQKTINDLIVLIKLSKDNNKYLSKEIKNLNNQNLNVDTYFQNIKLDYQKYIQQQLLISPNKNSVQDPKQKLSLTPDSDIRRAPKDKLIALEREEFLSIISNTLNITQLSFAEKGKLYELWATFKEFNQDILVSILEEFKIKTPDFQKSFLYYLAQIKNLYLENIQTEHKKGR